MARSQRIGWMMAASLAATMLVLGVVECSIRVMYWARNSRVTYVPLPYVIGHDYGPVPPWMDSLLILAPDNDLIWRNRPNLTRRYVDIFTPIHSDEERLALFRRFSPNLPPGLNGSASWDISLNSEGFRDQESPSGKPPPSFRIVSLGDSWTFGMNVEQSQAYPQRLGAMLRQQFPTANFEVLNRGVLGYSSFQGAELLRTRVLNLNPDVVVIAYAMNDSKVTGYRDKDLALWEKNLPFKERAARLVENSETYKLLRYLALILRYKPQPIGFHLKSAADNASNRVDDFEKLDQWTRVGLKDYRRNMTDMIRLARDHGAHVILLYNELWENGLYLRALQELAETEHVPLIDANAIIRREQQRIEHELESRLGLAAATSGNTNGREVEVVFRLYSGSTPVPRRMCVVGPDPALGDNKPNTVAMYDDGTHGDQRAGDLVWSYATRLSPGSKVFYVYTNSGPPNRWEGLDVPYIRQFDLTREGHQARLYRPIETFGRVYAQADSWHPDAAGYDLIANAVLETLQHDDRFREHVRRSQITESFNAPVEKRR